MINYGKSPICIRFNFSFKLFISVFQSKAEKTSFQIFRPFSLIVEPLRMYMLNLGPSINFEFVILSRLPSFPITLFDRKNNTEKS